MKCPQHNPGPRVKSSINGSYFHRGDTFAASCAWFWTFQLLSNDENQKVIQKKATEMIKEKETRNRKKELKTVGTIQPRKAKGGRLSSKANKQ